MLKFIDNTKPPKANPVPIAFEQLPLGTILTPKHWAIYSVETQISRQEAHYQDYG